jgi:hypothetical protein
MTKNYPGCFACLSNPTSCSSLASENENGSITPEACCPFVEEAVTCSNCLSKYSQNALQNCLSTGPSTGFIIGISVGVVVFLIVTTIVIYVWVRTKRNFKAKQKLIQNTTSAKGKRLISMLNSDVGSQVFADVQQRQTLLQNSKLKTTTDNAAPTF